MTTLARVIIGILLITHGLVHLLFLVKDATEPQYPFSLDRSWLLPEPIRRPFGHLLLAAVIIAFTTAALAWWDVPGLAAAWVVLLAAACLSLVLLAAFFDVRLGVGVLIDIVLIAVALAGPSWVQSIRP